MINNIPDLKLGIVAVSRGCFPASLSKTRMQNIANSYGEDIYQCSVIVEDENDALLAVNELKQNGVNALVVFLGNFGPENAETLLGEWFDGPLMYAAAAEGDGNLVDGRGDAYCGMLNCSYNLGLRNIKAFIPKFPVGLASDVCEMIEKFKPIARAVIGMKKLKIITFGPRPNDFLACNAPIKPLYDLGVAIEENSELDLYAAYKQHNNDPRIPELVKEMQKEIGESSLSGILPKLAQYEITLNDWMDQHKGVYEYIAFANKCWPAFQTEFGFVPCYVNSRFAARGIPISCEVDIYGALSEYIAICVTQQPVTLLDINNSVPASIFEKGIKGKYDVRLNETFMGFHCGNTCASMVKNPHLGYQLIMKRSLEPDAAEPDITRGTLEGDLKAGDITLFRLQSTADTSLKAYIAQGAVLDVPTESFGSIGIIAIPEMERFYRHVLLEKRFPHHTVLAFGKQGEALFDILKYLGITDIGYNRPKSLPYDTENPF